MEYNILNISNGGVLLTLNGHFTINRVVYYNPIISARLLTIKEIERVNYINIEHPASRMQIEEDILNNVFDEVVGLGSSVDWDECEAGLIETIVNAITLTSIAYLTDTISKFNESFSGLHVVNSMSAIVSRFMSTPFAEVEKLPINELFRRYAICVAAFPQEVMPLKEEE